MPLTAAQSLLLHHKNGPDSSYYRGRFYGVEVFILIFFFCLLNNYKHIFVGTLHQVALTGKFFKLLLV
jgi:hypothetical protein